MAKTRSLIYHYKGIPLPVKIHFERRSSSRVSLGRDAILLRVPTLCRGPLLKNQLSWMGQWLESTFSKKPEQLRRLVNHVRPYAHGQVLTLFDGDVTLDIHYEDRKMLKGQFHQDRRIIYIWQPSVVNVDRSQVSNLISRCLATQYQSHFEDKVIELNSEHFEQPIREVRLKNNSSNWGSCSSNSIINLSTRLLLVPEAVQDYVVIHELAHLIELNHSQKFWSLVEKAMPEYREHEKWLKAHGAALTI